MAARECYIAMLEMDDHLQTMNIEIQRPMGETMEGLEEIPLDNSRLERTTRIGTLVSPSVCQALAFTRKPGRFCLK